MLLLSPLVKTEINGKNIEYFRRTISLKCQIRAQFQKYFTKLLFKIVWSGGAKEINLKEKRSIGISFLISLMIVLSTSLMLMLDKDSFHYPTLEVGKG